MNETRTLAEFVARLRYEDLSPAVVDQACRVILGIVMVAYLVLSALVFGKGRLTLSI